MCIKENSMKAEKNSLRVTFDTEEYKFMSDYKEAYGVSIQFFVESAVKEKILGIKIKEDLEIIGEE